jgi:hypothetical protein
MSKHAPEIALRQILAHAREAVAVILGKTRAELDKDQGRVNISPNYTVTRTQDNFVYKLQDPEG